MYNACNVFSSTNYFWIIFSDIQLCLVDTFLIIHNFSAAKYDVAISTACAGLDYIVVEKTSAAQACVELLRSQNLGVATFMILVDNFVRLAILTSFVSGVRVTCSLNMY